MSYHRELKAALAAATLLSATFASGYARSTELPARPAKETPLDMVNALHTAFGEHHARAVHTKGIIFEGVFTPTADAASITKAPIFAQGQLPVIARFSLFAGVPNLPDNDDGASPAGIGIKIKSPTGDDVDIEVNQHPDFITATFDEFAIFLRAVGAAGKGDTAPLHAFLGSHPHAKQFLETRTYSASFATAKYFGINALKFTNASGKISYVRYQLIPQAGEKYLTPEQRKSEGGNYLHEEIGKRVASGPVVFDLVAQIAEQGDKIEDPSIAWPDTRRQVRLGTFQLTRAPADPESTQKTLLLLPGEPHPGIEPADPMLVMRNIAYPISFGQRQ